MTETMFEGMTKRLKEDISKEIAYHYAVFATGSTERVISKMKRNIPLKDRKFLDGDIQILVGKDMAFPYDILNSSLEKHILDFYDEIRLSLKTSKELSEYGVRGEQFERKFNDKIEQSKISLVSMVKRELNLKMMQNKDAKSAIDHIQKVLTKRLKSLEIFLKDSAGQLGQYMLLWDYQDKGYTHYRLKANGDTCEECIELNGKVFPIFGIEAGETFLPFHPNCDCTAQVLDENGKAIASDRIETEIEKNDGKLEYLSTSLKQIILGNYSDSANLLGTLGQVALGFLGFDLPADIRDLIYDVTNFETSPKAMLQTLLDVLAMLPVVGGLKYIDEASEALKPVAKYGDDAADAVKTAENVINSADKNLTKDASIAVDNYIKNNVNPHFQKNVKEAFESDAKVTVLEQDIVVYRYHGGTSSSNGHWYTPNQTTDPASELALPPGNTYQYKDVFIVPKGMTVLEGTVAPNFGQLGGGYQFYISDTTKLIKK